MAEATADGSGLDIAGLERIASDCWPPAATMTLGGWRLGFMDGVTRRANAVLPLAWTAALDLESAIDTAEDRYRARGLPTVFKLTQAAAPAGLAEALTVRGYGREGDSDVLARCPTGLPRGPNAHMVRLLDAPTPEWCAVSFAGRSDDEAAVLNAMACRVEAPRAFGVVEIDGAAACAGFAALSDGWAVIAGVHTLAQARRLGAATSLMAALARWSAEAGARRLVLQVECDNIAASALYRGLGFERLYGYHYRVAREPARRP